MIEGIGYYSTENEPAPNPERLNAIRRNMEEILMVLERDGKTSHMELLSLPATEDSPLQDYDIINTSLLELARLGAIYKTIEVTDQQNAIICYELNPTD